MALHGIDYLPDNLERVEISEMSSEMQKQWFMNWKKQFNTDKTIKIQDFLQDAKRCPEQLQELAKEPLLLYMLAAMHRDDQLELSKFKQTTGTTAKILVYEQALEWVLTKQRSDNRHPKLNYELTRQNPEVLRRLLAEAAVCVVQSGGESASMQMVKARLQQDDEARELIKQAEEKLGGEALKTALGAFYLKSSSSGGVEFFHKSFREFLCAERLKQKLEDWTESGKRGKKYNLDDKQLYWDIYDFLGYGGLTPEIVEYLMGLLAESQEFKPTDLFQRLESFYRLWSDGEFIDSSEETLPRKKARELQKHNIQLGQRQVDIFAGLNIMILLLELHRYGQQRDDLKQEINFYPSGQPSSDNSSYRSRLLRIINYSDSVQLGNFNEVIGKFLFRANLVGANLVGANLDHAHLIRANLYRANLDRARLIRANLIRANLIRAHLEGAILLGAILSDANLEGANLSSAILSDANLEDARLDRARLVRANLDRANLSGADLSGAKFGCIKRDDKAICTNLINAKNLIPEQVKLAKDWEQAKYNEADRVLLGLPPEPAMGIRLDGA